MNDFKEKYINPLFETAEIARFTPDQMLLYEDSLKYYRDLKNSLDTARQEGKMEGKMEMVKLMILNGEPLDKIVKFSGLKREEIEKIKFKE